MAAALVLSPTPVDLPCGDHARDVAPCGFTLAEVDLMCANADCPPYAEELGACDDLAADTHVDHAMPDLDGYRHGGCPRAMGDEGMRLMCRLAPDDGDDGDVASAAAVVPFSMGRAKKTATPRMSMAMVTHVCGLLHKPRGQSYGQDYVLMHVLNDVEGTVQIVTDGNGADGEVVSLFCAETLLDYLVLRARLLLELCLTGDMAGIEELMTQGFVSVDELLCTTPGPAAYARESGSTCTVLLTLIHGKRRFVLTSYIGDSPALIVCSDGQRKLLTEYEHNPENVREFRRHVSRMQDAGLEPEPYTLHRANYPGNPSVPYPCQGRFEPIPLYVVDEEGQFVPNLRGVRALQSVGMPVGGCQSLRRFVERHPVTGDWVAIPGHEHENMASTVNGITQLTRCFGNSIQKPQVDAEPTSILCEVQPDRAYTAMLMSDGVGDLWFVDADDPDLPSWVKSESIFPLAVTQALLDGVRPGELGRAIMASSFDLARKPGVNPSFEVVLGADGEESPRWDDCSVAGVFLPRLC